MTRLVDRVMKRNGIVAGIGRFYFLPVAAAAGIQD